MDEYERWATFTSDDWATYTDRCRLQRLATAATADHATVQSPHSWTSGNHGVAAVAMQQSHATVEGAAGSGCCIAPPPLKGGAVATPPATPPATASTQEDEEEDGSAAATRLPDYAEVRERGTCRSCGASIVWVITHAGKRMPVDFETGVSHFATCPQASAWRKR